MIVRIKANARAIVRLVPHRSIDIRLGLVFAEINRATLSIAEFDERRRKDKETLQARLRGEES